MNTPVGILFFRSIAKPETVRSILSQTFDNTAAILRSGLEPGAVGVVLEFIGYSGRPLAEDLLPQVKFHVSQSSLDEFMVSDFDAVEEFVVLPETRHCPHDEKPEMVSPLIESLVLRYSKSSTALAPGI
ncbi:hypothetical protein YC2023_042212 [Brassica napus]